MNRTPVACTLNGPAHETRIGEIRALTRASLIEYERRDLALDLRYRPEAATEVRRISLLEQQCCAFLSFHVAAMEGTVRLTITAPESARSVADDLFGPFLPPESSAPLAVSAGSQRSGSLARATATGAACAACCAAPVLWPRIVALAGAGGVGAWAGGALGVGAVAAAIMVAGRFAVGRWRGLSTLGSER